MLIKTIKEVKDKTPKWCTIGYWNENGNTCSVNGGVNLTLPITASALEIAIMASAEFAGMEYDDVEIDIFGGDE